MKKLFDKIVSHGIQFRNVKIHQPIQVEIYKDNDGYVPFTEWLESLDLVTQFRIEERLDRVSLGNLGDYKTLEQGVLELKFTFGPGYRIYFGQKDDRIILLLSGGNKKAQKKDIKRAIKYWKTYLEGAHHESKH